MPEKKNTCLAVIAARSGSKGLPGKNIIDLWGKPLIAWSIAAAKESRRLTFFLVSTDSEEIAACARAEGAPTPFLRPAELAQDTSLSMDVVLHALDSVESAGFFYDNVMLLQPTSPFRTAADIDRSLELFIGRQARFCVSVTRMEHPVEWCCRMDSADVLQPILAGASFPRRQDLQDAYSPNGAIFIADVAALREYKNFYHRETIGYVMPRKRALDIDCMDDLLLARAMCHAYGDSLFDDSI